MSSLFRIWTQPDNNLRLRLLAAFTEYLKTWMRTFQSLRSMHQLSIISHKLFKFYRCRSKGSSQEAICHMGFCKTTLSRRWKKVGCLRGNPHLKRVDSLPIEALRRSRWSNALIAAGAFQFWLLYGTFRSARNQRPIQDHSWQKTRFRSFNQLFLL